MENLKRRRISIASAFHAPFQRKIWHYATTIPQTIISTRQFKPPFLKKSAEMRLLNSNIPQGAQATRYSNKKAQDILNLVLFMFCSFFVSIQMYRYNDPHLNPAVKFQAVL